MGGDKGLVIQEKDWERLASSVRPAEAGICRTLGELRNLDERKTVGIALSEYSSLSTKYQEVVLAVLKGLGRESGPRLVRVLLDDTRVPLGFAPLHELETVTLSEFIAMN